MGRSGQWLAALVGLLFSVAGSIPAFGVELDAARLPYEHIADATSQPGESEQAFLLRIAPQLRAFSDKTGFEACGVIASDGRGAFGVVLGSSLSHLACVNDHSRVPAGMTDTGETIHSHGRQGAFNMSKADKLLRGIEPGPDLVPVHGQDLGHFSRADYAGGAGYLATPDGLMYQHGDGTEATVSATTVAAAGS